MNSYLMIGVGFYLGLAVCRLNSFRGATFMGILRGAVLGILIWPLAILAVYLYDRNQKPEDTHPIREH